MSKKYVNTRQLSTSKDEPSRFVVEFYSPGYSSIMASYSNLNLSFRFYPYTEKDNVDFDKYGFDQYDFENSMTTNVNDENAEYLYRVIQSILEDRNSEKEIREVLDCGNATLIFEYKPDEDDQMAVYLTIEKNGQSIPFKFMTKQKAKFKKKDRRLLR